MKAHLMRGSVEPVAVARDVASSSPSKPPSALDMMRYQRISPDCLPLANGGSSRKPTPAAPRSSKDDDAPAVATDSSRLASYLAATSLGSKPRARAPQPSPPAPAQAAPSSSMTRSPARDHSHHYPSSDFPDPTSPSSTGGGPSGSAGHDATTLLQWGQNKRSRGRRDASAVSASASTPSPQRRQAGVKIQHRSSAPAEKLMPPPSYPRGSTLRVSSFLPARGGGVDAHHGRNAHPHHRSVEERAGGQSSSAAAGASRAEKQQRPGADKADAGAMVTGTQESKHQQGGRGGHQAEHHGPGSSSKAAAAQKQLPRIYTSLSRKEKEEDFLVMKGTKLPQRPKKRPKAVERAVNFICPGTWLSDVTRSRYEVREKKCTKKQKRRGLKGMEMDSDSD